MSGYKNMMVFSGKKMKLRLSDILKIQWCIKGDSSIRDGSPYLKNWFYNKNKNLWTHIKYHIK